MMNGHKWAQTHQASINSILDDSPGRPHRRVSARGARFYNEDRFTARILTSKLVQSLCFGNDLTPTMVRDALAHANAYRVTHPEIVVASVPEVLPPWLMRASLGGNYHEAWHTVYSCRRDITFEEVWEPLQVRWGKLPKQVWKQLLPNLLHWENICEDIRIEQIGRVEFPHTLEKMEALRDLILHQEDEAKPPQTDVEKMMFVASGGFRDLGLGYQTPRQMERLEKYKTLSPMMWRMLTEGDLRPLILRAQKLKREDVLGSFWLAFDVVTLLWQQATQPPEEGKKEGGAPNTPPPEDVDLSELTPPEEGDCESEGVATPYPMFKVGDRAIIKEGPLAGREVEVTFAGLPNKQGQQDLQYRLIPVN